MLLMNGSMFMTVVSSRSFTAPALPLPDPVWLEPKATGSSRQASIVAAVSYARRQALMSHWEELCVAAAEMLSPELGDVVEGTCGVVEWLFSSSSIAAARARSIALS